MYFQNVHENDICVEITFKNTGVGTFNVGGRGETKFSVKFIFILSFYPNPPCSPCLPTSSGARARVEWNARCPCKRRGRELVIYGPEPLARTAKGVRVFEKFAYIIKLRPMLRDSGEWFIRKIYIFSFRGFFFFLLLPLPLDDIFFLRPFWKRISTYIYIYVMQHILVCGICIGSPSP